MLNIEVNTHILNHVYTTDFNVTLAVQMCVFYKRQIKLQSTTRDNPMLCHVY